MTRPVAAMLALVAVVALSAPALSQGVFVPTPGSAPTVVGPGSTNPSAAASGGGAATNPSAAASSVSTPGALNPSGTSSSFAPTISSGSGNRVLTRPLPVARAAARARPPRRVHARPAVRGRHTRQTQTVARTGGRAVLLPPKAAKAADERARRITGSVCTGC